MEEDCIAQEEGSASQYSVSSSAYAAASSSKVIFVHPPTLGKKFDSDVWETGLFQVSKVLIDGVRKIKCLACEQLGKSLGGHDWHSG